MVSNSGCTECFLLHYEWFSHFVNYILTAWFILKNKSISDQVFGANLANLCQRENGTVPKFVKLCIEHVEEYGKKMIFFKMLSTPTHYFTINIPRIFMILSAATKNFLPS